MAHGYKTGGRQAGTPNKTTKELRDILKAFVCGELETLPETLAALPADKRAEILVKLLPFVLPKVDTVNATFGEGIWNT